MEESLKSIQINIKLNGMDFYNSKGDFHKLFDMTRDTSSVPISSLYKNLCLYEGFNIYKKSFWNMVDTRRFER